MQARKGRGLPLQVAEESLKAAFESIQRDLNRCVHKTSLTLYSPNQYKSQLIELISTIRGQEDLSVPQEYGKLDEETKEQIFDVRNIIQENLFK